MEVFGAGGEGAVTACEGGSLELRAAPPPVGHSASGDLPDVPRLIFSPVRGPWVPGRGLASGWTAMFTSPLVPEYWAQSPQWGCSFQHHVRPGNQSRTRGPSGSQHHVPCPPPVRAGLCRPDGALRPASARPPLPAPPQPLHSSSRKQSLLWTQRLSVTSSCKPWAGAASIPSRRKMRRREVKQSARGGKQGWPSRGPAQAVAPGSASVPALQLATPSNTRGAILRNRC